MSKKIEKYCVQCGCPLDESYEEKEDLCDFCEMLPTCSICDIFLEDAEEMNSGICIGCDEEE